MMGAVCTVSWGLHRLICGRVENRTPTQLTYSKIQYRAPRSEERRVGKDVVGVDLGGRRIIKKKFF